jgi:GAF domain-containing protein
VVISLITTFSLSQLMKSSRLATIASLISIAIATLLLYLDLFEPFKRIPNQNITATWIIAGGVILVYALIILRRFPSYSLRNKFLVAFVGVTVVVTGVLAMFYYSSTTNNLRSGLENELKQHSDSIASRISDLFNEQINILTALSLNEVLQQAVEESNVAYQGDTAAIQATLAAREAQWIAAAAANNNADPLIKEHLTNAVALDLLEFQAAFPENFEIFVTDVYGGLVGASNRTSDYYQADEDWWQAAYNNGQGAAYISKPAIDESTGRFGVQIVLPLRSRDTGKVVGILRTTYTLSKMLSILAEQVGQTGQADLYIPGEVASHFHAGQYSPVEPGEFARLQAFAGQGMVETGYEGIPSVVIQAPIQTPEGNLTVDNLGWVIIFHQYQDEAFAPVNAQLRIFIIVMVIVFLLAVGAAFGVSLLVVRPITQLTRTAEEISAGNYEIRAEVTSGDEIGTLAIAFNTMTSRLRDFIATLEQRVADRTKALATSSEVSRRLSTIINQKELVTEVVNQVKDAFGYYHTQIYFYDEANENLVMAGGTGEAGEMMLAQFHKVVKGRGLVGRAAETNAPVLVSDTSKDPGWLPNSLLPKTKSEIAVPITVGNQVLGVLDVQHNITDGLQQEEVDSLQSIANQVAVAIQNIRQYEKTRKIAADMGMVANVGIATSTITESGQLLQKVVELSKKSFNLYHAHIYLLNEVGDTLELAAGAGEVGRQMVSKKHSILLDREQSLVARAARTREGVVVNDVTTAPDFLPNPLLPDTRSEMAVPMLAAGKVIGVLDVQSEIANRFTDIDVSIQTTLASQVAVALQNARSFSQSQRQAQRETALNLITQKIQNATSIESALQIAARELGHALGMKPTLVELNPVALATERKSHEGAEK